MADLPGDVGYLTVVGNAAEVIADSVDGGLVPDILPLEATVILSPVGLPRDRPYLLALADQKILLPRAISCNMTGGQLYPPNDGSDWKPDTGDGDPELDVTPGVRLMAPIQASLNYLNWYWEAQFVPPSRARWKAFNVYFTGAPGDTVPLANAAATMSQLTSLALVEQPNVYLIHGSTPPPQALANDFLVDVDTGDFYIVQEAS